MTAVDTRPARRVALVTVTYNSGPVLEDFLASLDRQTSRDWTLVAVDNNSTDATHDMLAAWQERGPLHLIANPDNPGFAAASNQGIVWARENGFDAVLLINNDTVFGVDFIAEIMAFQAMSGAPLVAPAVTYADDPKRYWFADGGFTHIRGGFQAWMGETPREGYSWTADFAPACALLVDMQVFDRIGMFDERFFVYWEDADFCLRCREAGLAVTILAAPTIAHKVSALTGGTSPFSTRMYHHNQILLLKKHFGELSAWLQSPAIIAKILARRVTGMDDNRTTGLRLRTVGSALAGRGRNGK